MPDSNDLKEISLNDLQQRCSQVNSKEVSSDLSDQVDRNRYCFELFRRAVQDGDQLAWEAVYEKFKPRVDIWVKGSIFYTPSMEDVEYFTNRAFEKMWAGLSPDKLEKLPAFDALLRYLQMCVHSAVMQNLRGRAKTAFLDEYVDPVTEREALSASAVPPIPVPAGAGIEDRAFIQTQAETLWNMLQERLQNDGEHRFVYARYVLALQPDQILARYPELFKDIGELNQIRERLLEQLSQDKEVREFFDLDEVDLDIEELLIGTLYRIFCPESQELGELYLGLLLDERAASVQDHLGDCLHCTRELDQLRAYLDALQETG